jgi:hypothetical protein
MFYTEQIINNMLKNLEASVRMQANPRSIPIPVMTSEASFHLREAAMNTGRKEIKYLIPLLQFKKLEQSLLAILRPDASGDPQGLYHVRSLYFDSFHNDDYYDVLKGAETRKKIRLRVYPPQGRIIKLEYKLKQGTNQQKTSLLLSKTQAKEVIAGNYGLLANYPNPQAAVLHHEMTTRVYRPKVLIEYDRLALYAPGNDIRVTFDTKIRASMNCGDLFSTQVNYTPLITEDQGVLEVKYDGFLYTYIQNLLSKLDTLPIAVSKYILGRTDLH